MVAHDNMPKGIDMCARVQIHFDALLSKTNPILGSFPRLVPMTANGWV
jgi:hypothetical protein